MRKLATIQRIADLKPIEGADKIEVATVLGWHVVVKKGEFKVGDLCTYFEVDSLLPLLDIFSFLEKSGARKKMLIDGKEVEGYRLKTVRLRGQVSQGLVVPLVDKEAHKEGDDVTEILGVYKYEPPIPAILSGIARGVFPAFVPKTDETRIQAFPQVLERHKNKECYVTEKLDGSSCTVFIKDGELHVCSRSLDLQEDDSNSFWRVAKMLNMAEKIKKIGDNFVFQGELVGEGIQSNKLKLKGQMIYFYNIYDKAKAKYLDFAEFSRLCFELDLQLVPIVGKLNINHTVDDLVKEATRKSVINPDTWAEGIVIRPLVEESDEDLGRLSFKVINPEFLLFYGE